jgi:hypothetical protein
VAGLLAAAHKRRLPMLQALPIGGFDHCVLAPCLYPALLTSRQWAALTSGRHNMQTARPPLSLWSIMKTSRLNSPSAAGDA